MTDPVAEAAAQLAALSVANMTETDASTPFLDRIAEGLHDLEAKVEHLIHPDAPGNVPAVAGESVTAPAIADSGNASAATAQSIPAEAAAAPTSSVVLDALQPAVELPNADASTPPAGDAIDAAGDSGNAPAVAAANLSSAPSTESDESTSAGDSPNAASVAVEPTTALGSASNAAGESITSTIGASFAEPPLCMRVATHLEAIYQLVRDEVEAAPAGPDTSALKTLVGEILFRISNGMAVSEGDMVQKLEALYRAL